jgi:hypothetical protein
MHKQTKTTKTHNMANEAAPWTADYSLRHFELPGTLADSLREHRDRCERDLEFQRIQANV